MSEYVKTHKRHAILFAIMLTVCVSLVARYAFADPVSDTSTYNSATGRWEVTWGENNTGRHVLDTCPAGAILAFVWTSDDGDAHEGYTGSMLDNMSGSSAVKLKFILPDDATITDWKQSINTDDGNSDVHAGNIKHSSPWALYPLEEIAAGYRIPDFAPTAGAGLTIYTAVNLELYTTENANGPLGGDWDVGDTLGDLSLTITNGTILGVEGLYFATCEFELDPDSDTGWVPVDGPTGWLDSGLFTSTYGGAIKIVGAHQQVGSP